MATGGEDMALSSEHMAGVQSPTDADYFGMFRFRPYDVTPEDIRSVLNAATGAFFCSVINALIFIASAWSAIGGPLLIGWLLVSLTVFVTFYVRSVNSRGRKIKRVSRSAVRRLAMFSALLAAPWGFLAMAFLGAGDAKTELTLITVCAGMSAGGAFMLHRAPIAAVAYFYTILLSVVAACLVRDVAAYWPIIVYVLPYGAFLLAMVVLGGRTARERDAMLEATAERNEKLRVAHAEISRLAFEDTVTGLPNRKAFTDRLDARISEARRDGNRFAYMMLDLDRFKNVNDTLGHVAGDALLNHIATRLRGSIRAHDFAARLGGDEFGVIASDVRGADDVSRRGRRILQSLAEPLTLGGSLIHPKTSIGVAVFPDDADDASELLKRADIALNRAKEMGRGVVAIYDEQMERAVAKADELERELRLALENGGLEMRYQPKIDVVTRQVAGAEALIRWIHPERGPIPPPVFLAVAEERGLLLDVSRFVFDRVGEDLLRFRRISPGAAPIAINISPVDLKNPRFLFEQVTKLRSRGLREKDVVFEITEGCVVGRGADEASMTIDRLHEMGVALSLDDFGTGHASLSHLKRLPVTELKVDCEFVRGILDDSKDRAIVAAAVEICRVMGLRCVAEGVETEEQFEALRELGCDRAQGFLFSPALEREAFADLLRQHMPFKRAG